MISRRKFIKGTGLAALAHAVACESSSDAAPATDAGGDSTSGSDDLGATDGDEDVDEPNDLGASSDANDDASEDVTPDTGPKEPLPEYEYDGPLGPEDLFRHNVASGDPLEDRVILWTRTSTQGTDPLDVFYEMALDAEFVDRVAAGWTQAHPDDDFTVKVDPTGLAASTTYYYRFKALGRTSPIGRTRTTGGRTRLRLALASCQEYQNGYYYAHRHIGSRADLDAVVFLGDYIYEYGPRSGAVRDIAPQKSITTLEEVRERYSHYRLDHDLQEAHRQHPWFVVWDDHEFGNNAWNGGGFGRTGAGWDARRELCEKVWREWLPVRGKLGDPIYRAFEFGDFASLVMLDTRIEGREEPINPNAPEGFDAPDRTLLGAEQEAWFAARAAEAGDRWFLVAQQVMMAPLTDGTSPLNYDQWDGFPAARDRLYDAVAENGIDSMVVFTGDIHSTWGNDLPRDFLTYDPSTGDGSMGVELVTPGITSFAPSFEGVAELAQQLNPHIRHAEVGSQGYTLVDFDASRVKATWVYAKDIQGDDPAMNDDTTVTCPKGDRKWTVGGSADPAPDAPPLAP